MVQLASKPPLPSKNKEMNLPNNPRTIHLAPNILPCGRLLWCNPGTSGQHHVTNAWRQRGENYWGLTLRSPSPSQGNQIPYPWAYSSQRFLILVLVSLIYSSTNTPDSACQQAIIIKPLTRCASGGIDQMWETVNATKGVFEKHYFN